MLETKMHCVTLVILLLQTMTLFFQIINCLVKPHDISQKRFLVFILVFMNYNFFSGIYPNASFTISTLFQNLIAYIFGVILFLYFIYYIYEKFQMKRFRFYTIKQTLYYSIIFVISLFVLPYLVTKNFSLSIQLLVLLLVIVTLVLTYVTIKKLTSLYADIKITEHRQRNFQATVVLVISSILFFQVLPVVFFFEDYQYVIQPLINAGFFIITFVYLKEYIDERKEEIALLISLKEYEIDMKKKIYLKITI